MSSPFRLRLPATSANLGPGFDTVAVALDFFLKIEAEPANQFSIEATGHDSERCARIENNLILDTYRRLLIEKNKPIVPIAIRMVNGIPLGMGCGSSAAGRLAAIAMAVHFGQLGWSDDQILEEASVLEGHPDNAAACWLGGFITAACNGRTVHVARVAPSAGWRAIVVFPPAPLPTSEARAVLPAFYSRADVVSNIQAVSLLGVAFAQARGDLLRIAMNDRIHQPYRAPICPMLLPLVRLAGQHGILGVSLSGAGPSVLVIVEGEASIDKAAAGIRAALGTLPAPELRVCRFQSTGAGQ
jgi:homoserine kinase